MFRQKKCFDKTINEVANGSPTSKTLDFINNLKRHIPFDESCSLPDENTSTKLFYK